MQLGFAQLFLSLKPMTLDQLPLGQSAIVRRLTLDPSHSAQLMEMGLYEGARLTLVRKAPLGDPLELKVGDFSLSLRKEQASGVEIDPVELA